MNNMMFGFNGWYIPGGSSWVEVGQGDLGGDGVMGISPLPFYNIKPIAFKKDCA